MQDLGWIPVGLGAAAQVAVRRGRKRGAVALTATTGADAVGALRSVGRAHGKADSKPQVERSITIGRQADALRQYWRDPKTLP